MCMQQAIVAARPQLIPTNEGGRTFAAPPAALQTPITPNELFYIRNHWKEPPRLDPATYGPDEVVGDPPEVTYQRALPVAKAMHPDTLLAYEMNGEALPVMHGAPLRLIVPGWYGMTSVKWLVDISVIDHAFDGFYQRER